MTTGTTPAGTTTAEPATSGRGGAEGGYGLIAGMCFAEMVCMAGFATYPALLPTFRAAWSFSNGEAGLVGGVLFLGYVGAVPVLTSLSDRIDARRIYIGSTLVAAAGSAVFATLAHGLLGALVAQFLFGVGFGGIYMPGLKAMSDRIPERLQSRAVALYTSLSGFGLSGSYFLAGWIAPTIGWRWAFAAAALGPLVALVIALVALAPRAPPEAAVRLGMVASFRLVFRNKPALGYIGGYVAHCWELYGVRAWMVAFVTFAGGRSLHAAGHLGAPTLASIIALGGIVSSIGCNEFAKRLGRANLVTGIMAAGLVFGIATGGSWRMSLWSTLTLLALYYAVAMADSGALTAGTVAAARPGQRGATLGVHSMLGFAAGLVAPTTFGLVLDLAGGAESGVAWALSFTVLALPNLVGIVVLRRLTVRRDAGEEVVAAPRVLAS
jgi:MFS family permease